MAPLRSQSPCGPRDDDDSDTDTLSDGYTSESDSEPECETSTTTKAPRIGLDKDDVITEQMKGLGLTSECVLRKVIYRVKVIVRTETQEEMVLFTKHFKKQEQRDEDSVVGGGGLPANVLRKIQRNRAKEPEPKLPLRKTIFTVRKTAIVVKITVLKTVSLVKRVKKHGKKG